MCRLSIQQSRLRMPSTTRVMRPVDHQVPQSIPQAFVLSGRAPRSTSSHQRARPIALRSTPHQPGWPRRSQRWGLRRRRGRPSGGLEACVQRWACAASPAFARRGAAAPGPRCSWTIGSGLGWWDECLASDLTTRRRVFVIRRDGELVSAR
jgi:hypothetical protein